MAEQYFRIIKTEGKETEDVVREHNQKLHNYLKYDWPTTDDQLYKDKPMGPQPIGYKKEIESQSTTSCMKNFNYVLVTVLCCEDEYPENTEQK